MNSTAADHANVGDAATDISFSNFVALDFDQQFELVAAHHHTEPQTSPKGSTMREVPAAKRRKCNLDDSDGEAANESDGEVGFDLSALLNQAAQAPHDGQTCGRWH